MRLHTLGFYIVNGLAVTASSFAIAQTAPTSTGFGANGVLVQSVRSNSAAISGSNVVSMQTFRVQNGTAPPKFYDRAVAFTKSTYGGMAKNFIKANALQLGLTAVILGVGYLIDYITGDIQRDVAPAQSCNITYKFNPFNYGRTFCTLEAAKAQVAVEVTAYNKQAYGNPNAAFIAFTNNPQIIVPAQGYINSYDYDYKSYTWGGPPMAQEIKTTNLKVTNYNQPQQIPASGTTLNPSEVADKMMEQSPAIKNAPFNNPNTGNTIRTSEVAAAEKALYNEIAPELGKAQSTDTPVNPLAPDVQQSIGRDTLDEVKNSTSLAFPNFCSWASYVCEAIDWAKSTGDKPSKADYKFTDSITTVDINEQHYTSGIGGGTCPSPKTFSVLGTSLSYTYQPICELAVIARIFVLLAAYISSVYIVMGVKR
jgi:hypothetical protein